jgi:hypothetical protein
MAVTVARGQMGVFVHMDAVLARDIYHQGVAGEPESIGRPLGTAAAPR